jgi:hypothetical protein
LSAPSSLRTEVCPPSLRHAPASAWQRLMCWLMAPAPSDAALPLHRLPQVRADFQACTADIASAEAVALRERVAGTRSLRELWHLRAEAYRVVALAYSESEATLRLAGLNKHFPTRAPRSAFATL